jgi:hypothetical protein
MTTALPWRWESQPQACAEPRAAVAWGSAAMRMLSRLDELPADAQARLSATAGLELLVVTGDAADLPWVEGIAYAAPSPHAPILWLPTLMAPDAPADLLARALRQRFERQPLLLWHAPEAVVPLDQVLPVSPRLLARIREQWQDR